MLVRAEFGWCGAAAAGCKMPTDVLTYTTPPLESDVEVRAEASAEIWSPPASGTPTCSSGRATSTRLEVEICDGLTSLTHAPALSMPAMAHRARVRRGHRIRVQVSSGSFPRYDARNAGPASRAPRQPGCWPPTTRSCTTMRPALTAVRDAS